MLQIVIIAFSKVQLSLDLSIPSISNIKFISSLCSNAKMSEVKCMLNLDINYKLSAMSKKVEKPASQKPRQPKKEIDEDVLARFQIEPDRKDENANRRRLKKLCEVNQSEEMLEPSEEEDDLLDEEEEEPRYEQFGIKDDVELQKEKEAEQEAKKNKKMRGNQQLDKFIQKQSSKPNKEKEDKPKPVQMTIEEMMRIKKEKQMKRRRSSDEFIDNQSSQEVNQQELQAKRMAAYERYNGSLEDQQKQIEKAIKLSLTASSVQKYEVLDDYAYEKNIKPAPKFAEPETKTVNKEREVKDLKQSKVESKEEKGKKQSKKPKAAPKETRTGPLAEYVIVFTGQFQSFDKDEFIEVCNQLGAECPKSITKKCNLLIQGSYVADAFKRKTNRPVIQTSKSKEALEKGIKIITHDQIDDFFIKHTGFPVDHHLSKNKVAANPVSSLLFKPLDSHSNKQATFAERKPEGFKQQPFKKEEKMDIEKVRQVENAKTASRDQVDRRLWTEKYKPTKLQEVIGQNNQVRQLREWLEEWQDIHIRGNKRDVKPGGKGWNAAGNINSTAALISGDPGIGKTTTARLLAMECNYSVTEFNASDIRNKSGVGLLETRSYGLDISRNLTKSLVIMDEVDGMSTGDRGGIAAIINLIKNSKVPIICICNDRGAQKIRSLAGHCLDVKFFKPNKTMVVKRLKEILIAEGGSGQDRALEQLVQTFQNDMRQILSYLQVVFKTVSTRITIDALSGKGRSSKDANVMINHFDAVRKLLNRTEFGHMRISERTDCFFVDSDMVPIMVHQNLLASARKAIPTPKEFHNLVRGVHGMVVGDVLDRSIRKEQEWGLMPSYGFMTCVYAPEFISESLGYPAFPSWLGKFSSEKKVRRLAREFKDVIFPQTMNGSWKIAKNQYAPLITRELTEFLKNELVQDAVLLMEGYRISPMVVNEHLSSLYYLDKSSNNSVNPLSDIPSTVKGKLTRMFNKRHGDAKLKQAATKGKPKVQHAKFDPLMEQVQFQQEQPSEQQLSEQAKPKPSKAKDAKKKK